MKNLKFILMALLAVSFTFISCDNKNSQPDDIDNIVEDGFYVAGNATGADKLMADAIMAAGVNEVDKKVRDGMYEKYIALEGGKEFYLMLKEGTKEVKYGATLQDVNLAPDGESVNDQPIVIVKKGELKENETLKVTESGLYHIVLDLNKSNDLEYAQIVIAPVTWGMRGGFNGWGFTELKASDFNQKAMTFSLEGVEIKSNHEFKFAYGGGWKIQLDTEGLVKAETNLGADMKPGGDNMKLEESGIYTVKLTWTLKQGAIAESYKAEFTKTGDIVEKFPTTLYMIGAEFGNWDWANESVAEMVPVNGVEGAFWAVRYFTAGQGFKWAPGKEWKDDFAQLKTVEGFTVSDGNAMVETDGFYSVYIDMAANKIVMEPAAVYGIGDTFGGWDAKMEAAKFAGDPATKTMTVTVAANGELRMYTESSAATSDWWTREFIILDGKIVYRGNDGDQERVSVTAGQVVTLNFNTGEGSIK